MKKYLWILAAIALLVLSACGGAPIGASATPIPTVALAGGPAQATSNTVSASAEITPVEYVQLSFPLTGTVTSVDVAEGDTVQAGQTLAQLDTTVLQAKVDEAQANVKAAETQVRYLTRVQTYVEDLDAAQAEIDRTQALLDSAKATLEQATLVTPMSGTVVSVDTAPGETATPGQIVIIVADLTRMQVETTDLSERDVPQVKVGQSVNIYVEALNKNFDGTVVEVARQSSTIGGDVVYKVTIELAEQVPEMRWGMTAEVKISTGE
jgi:RND family efflux transporter MFP subunit